MGPMQAIMAYVLSVCTMHLGEVSRYYEVGANGGPGVISDYDKGGNYGAYQFSARQGITQDYIKKSPFRSRFGTHRVGSKEFENIWKDIANKQAHLFLLDQSLYVFSSYLKPLEAKLVERGIGLSGRHSAVRQSFLSTAVQYGSAFYLIVRAYNNSIGTDESFINAIQDEKLKMKSGPGLKQRIEQEREKLINNLRSGRHEICG